MPKPLLNDPRTQQKSETVLSAVGQTGGKQDQAAEKARQDRLLRKPRSKEYMQALCGLDAGGHVQNREKVQSVLRTIQEEFPDVEIRSVLFGVIAVCHMGDPYEVHTLDLGVGILEHYPRGKVLPGGMERARGLAMRGGYAFIEVYADCCRCVSEDGSVSVVPY